MKPSTLPRWADLAAPGDIVDPPSGTKDAGWLTGALPPHSYFNWFQNLVYQWTVYLDGLTGEALTWTAAHIFSAAATFNNGIIVNKGGASAAINATGGISAVSTGSTSGAAITAFGLGSDNGVYGEIDSTATAGVFGVISGGGASTQSGVRGEGFLAAPGVIGVGTSTAGGYGVKGTSNATNTAGVIGISTAGGRGVEGVANAAGGLGVYGNSTAADGSGGYFTAPGTSGLGAAVSGYSAAGRAILSQGNFEVLGGHTTVPVDKDIKYAANRTEWVRVPLSALKLQNAGGVNINDLFFEDSSGTPSPGQWGSRSGASYDLVGSIVRVPAGATITRIEFLQSTTELTGGIRYRIFKEVDTAGGRTLSWGNPSGSTFDILGIAGPAAEAWYGQDISVVVPGNNDGASEYGGQISLNVRVDATLALNSSRLLGVRLKYVYTNIRTAP